VITSLLKNQTAARIKNTLIIGKLTEESFAFEANVIRRTHYLHIIFFEVLHACNVRAFAGNCYITDHSSKAVTSRHKASAVPHKLRARSTKSVLKNKSKFALHRLVFVIALL